MSSWPLLSLALPPLAAIAAAAAFRRRKAPPEAVIALNALMPGAGLAAARCQLLEVIAGVVVAILALFSVGRPEDMGFWLPVMAVGAAWGLLHTRYNPLTRAAERHAPDRAIPAPTARPDPPPRPAHAPGAAEDEVGYAVAVSCTECGAEVDVPVLHRMAQCPYCSSRHLVVGQEKTLLVALPERVSDTDALRAVVLDHYRYQHYIKLYRRHVAPLEAQDSERVGPGLIVSQRTELSVAAAAAEHAVSRRADTYRARVASKLQLGLTQHFLAPYRHGMGTLYQAIFGRSRRGQEKTLRFAVASVEASTLATTLFDLPPMGRLSYLRALLPAVQYSGRLRTLPLDIGEERLELAYGNLEGKRLVKELDVISQGCRFESEVTAVVWRPWWIVAVTAPGIAETLLVDSAAGSVVGPAAFLVDTALGELPDAARDPGRGLKFLPMQCPVCGFEFVFEPSEVLHFCRNCHRVCEVRDQHKVEVEYVHAPADGGVDIVPFWLFALRLRTADGQLLTDLAHLRDGIDGRLDQIGDDHRLEKDHVLVPAVRFLNPRLTVDAYDRLLDYVLEQRPELRSGRYPLEQKVRPWPVCLGEAEARRLAPLYLANVFGRHDLARVNVRQVATWLFESRLEGEGNLAYVAVPHAVTNTFRAFVGRFRGRALEEVERNG